MYVVIVGAGKFGVSLARWLVTNGHEISVIEREPSRCFLVEEELGSVVVLGDGTESGVLTKAGTNRADILIAATGLDDVNLVACQLAFLRYDVRRTMALVNISEHEELFRILGINVIVNVTDIVVSRLREEISSLVKEQVGEPE